MGKLQFLQVGVVDFAPKIFIMNIKEIIATPMSRREFLTRAFKLSIAAALPVDSIYNILPDDEEIIGEETFDLDDIIVRSTVLEFSKRLHYRKRTDAVIIHHVGNTDKNINVAAIHRWHKQNGWAGIGYHYIIRKDGSIERGRPVDTIGAHTYNQNDNTVGICVVGNFELSRPTSEQFRAAEKLVGAVCRHYDITPNVKTVRGHKDFCKTTCPGIYLYKWLPDIIRNAV